MRKFFELFTNDNGRASTTGFIQFFGFLVLAGVLVYSVYLGRDNATRSLFVFCVFLWRVGSNKRRSDGISVQKQTQ